MLQIRDDPSPFPSHKKKRKKIPFSGQAARVIPTEETESPVAGVDRATVGGQEGQHTKHCNKTQYELTMRNLKRDKQN